MEVNRNIIFILQILLIGFLFLLNNIAFAIVINPNTIITQTTQFDHTTLDLNNGNFIVENNAILTIENSVIIGNLSPTNPILMLIKKGSLVLNNNQIKITTTLIDPHPSTQSLAYVIKLQEANTVLTNNLFEINNPFTAGLLITDSNIVNAHHYIANNHVYNFHGVFYLLNSNNSIVENNYLQKNSYGNIVIMGKYAQINNNIILFSGRDVIGDGDAIDAINSNYIDIKNNVISTPSCFGIWILSSRNIKLDYNTITGGVTYGIRISNISSNSADIQKKIKDLYIKNISNNLSQHISITNNVLNQNRYGIGASDVDDLMIRDNFFSQRFKDSTTRQFWTDNNNLMTNVTHLSWINNLYKEAFTQENNGDNSNTQFMIFPKFGGVVL